MSDCDGCGEDVTEGVAVPTGEWDEEFNAPVVKIYCHPCYDRL